jgi:integrase
MGCIYVRNTKLWIRFKNRDGKWVSKSTGLPVGEEPRARKLLASVEAALVKPAVAPAGPVTVATYAKQWLDARRGRGLDSWADDESRIKHHVLPAIGNMPLGELRPRHIKEMLEQAASRPARRGGDAKLAPSGDHRLSPRSLRHVYAVTRNMLGDAVIDELIDSSPCVLKTHHLPSNRDAVPAWRETAVFTIPEIEALMADARIPHVRRVIYATLALTGMRAGEAAARRWRDINRSTQPLWTLNVVTSISRRTKKEKAATKVEGVVRYVPVHAVLQQVLDGWQKTGWPQMMGRRPVLGDLLFPGEALGGFRTSVLLQDLLKDLDILGLRRRRLHDLRRSFVSLCRSHGARQDIVQWISHGPGKSIVDIYTSFPWSTLCEEVAKVRIAAPAPPTALVTLVTEPSNTPPAPPVCDASPAAERRAALP